MLQIEERVLNVNRWIKDNRNTDLNAYEMVEMATAINNHKVVGGELQIFTLNMLKEAWLMRKETIVNSNLTEAALANEICEQVVLGDLSNTELSDSSIEVLKKISAIDLYLAQEKRNGNHLGYYNTAEYLYLFGHYNRMLNEEHPLVIEGYFSTFKSKLKRVNPSLIETVDEIFQVKRVK